MSGVASLECEIAIIGAGPYGLSTTAHLRAKGMGVDFSRAHVPEIASSDGKF